MHPNLLDPERSVLLVIDLQESYRPALHDWDHIIDRARVLIRSADVMEVPILFTEQYPKGLGPTTDTILECLTLAKRFEKRTLSALGADGLLDSLRTLDRSQVVICGIETHACIGQTALELLHQGFQVHLPKDALSSRQPPEHELGYQKLIASGALAASVESVALEWVRSSEDPRFKQIHALIK